MAASGQRVIKIIDGVEGLERFPGMLEEIGRWLVRYEPENAKRGERWIWTTDDPNEALRLSAEEAFDLVGRPIGTRPWDGKPDRPITVYTITIEPAP